MADEEEVEGYEANTVEELREELRARDLHTSGNKDELIARLEEDDAAAGATKEAPAEQAQVEEVLDYYPLRVYSPFELPANTAAAQAFIDTHPDAVDETIVLPDEQVAAAQASIQDHVDLMAEAGVTVEDPRLEGYTPAVQKQPELEEEAS
jgi:hypothetical protein